MRCHDSIAGSSGRRSDCFWPHLPAGRKQRGLPRPEVVHGETLNRYVETFRSKGFDSLAQIGENQEVGSVAEWACGAAGSALPWHGRGHRFDPDQVHQLNQSFRSSLLSRLCRIFVANSKITPRTGFVVWSCICASGISFAECVGTDFCSGLRCPIRDVGVGPDPHVPVSLSSS